MKANNDIVNIKWEVLHKFMQEVFVKVGLSVEDALTCADVLIAADLRGIDSHGINRFKPIYIDRLNQGIQFAKTEFEIVKEFGATAVIDGHNGMGQVISKRATQMAIDKAKDHGIGMTVVRNSTHYGIAGYYPLMCVENNMIGITGTNARPSIAPTFGIENMLGTNPLTVALPSDEDFPFLLDCATSISQRGKIEFYARNGKSLPDGWVIGQDGESVTDAEAALRMLTNGEAALVPLGGIGEVLGGYKGYGYATVVEILSAALQSGSFLKMLSGVKDGKKVPHNLGHFFIAINIESFTELDDFKKITGDILRALRNAKKMPGQDRIFTAGEKEYDIMQERLKNGIPVGEALQNEIKALQDEYSVTNRVF